MKVFAKFNNGQIRKILDQHKRKVEDAIVSRVRYIGEQFIINAREMGTYTDQTGNLRSSIGYVVIRNGVQLYDGFTDKGSVIGLKESKRVMKEVVKELIAANPSSIILVCVAGMSYAAAVEAVGYDVITGSSLRAQTALKNAMEKMKKKFG